MVSRELVKFQFLKWNEKQVCVCVYKSSLYLVNLVRELSCFLAVDCVGVQQGAEWLEIGLLFQQ